jgi:nucleotide-binding universal stress UspA family protein
MDGGRRPGDAGIMTGTVICGVDWRGESRSAVHVAGRLSERLGARLVLVHVAPTPTAPTVSLVPGGQATLAFHEERDAELLLAEVAAAAQLGMDVERVVAFGEPAEQLAALAADERAELVVVSSRGRRGLRSVLLGSVSGKLATNAPCPVVVVPPHVGRA